MANIEAIIIELVGGARLTVRQDGGTVEITADRDAQYEVIQYRPLRSVLELRFAPVRQRQTQGLFSPGGD